MRRRVTTRSHGRPHGRSIGRSTGLVLGHLLALSLVPHASALDVLRLQDAPPTTEGEASPELTRLRRLLTELSGDDSLRARAAERELRALRPRYLAATLDILCYRTAPTEATCDTLSAEGQTLLLERLAAWPQKDVATACIELARGGSLDLRLRSLELLGTCATATTWNELLLLFRLFGPEELLHPLVSEHLRQSLHAALERDPACYRSVDATLDGSEPWLERALIEALGMVGRGQALDLLASLLDRDPALDTRILRAMGGWKRWDESHEACSLLVRDYLRSPIPDVRRSAATALGRLEAGATIPHLMLALDDPHSGVRRSALWALRYITGHEFLTSSKEWLSWYEREEQWREERAPELLRTARNGAVSHALKALCELGQHPWFPDMAEELASVLEREEPILLQAGCNALANVGGPLAFHALVELCEDERPDVRLAARNGFELFVGQNYAEFDLLDLE